MLTYQEGLHLIFENTHPLETVRMPLAQLSGRVLAEDVYAPFPLPRFDSSAMDGYAVSSADFTAASEECPIPLKVVDTIRAGDPGTTPLEPGTVRRIMTGAILPPGADAVVKREDVETAAGLLATRPIPKGANIRRAGEERPQGSLLLTKGTRVTPPVAGLLATIGAFEAVVYRIPEVYLIITGDELLQPGSNLLPGRIFDSNRVALAHSLQRAGIVKPQIAHCRDDETALRELTGRALATADIVITVGGISVGDYDYVRQVNASLGVREIFWRLAIKPGKPVFFGTFQGRRKRSVLVFGLPGNPVSALVGLELFVKPALRKMSGSVMSNSFKMKARLLRELFKKDDRLEFLRGRMSNLDGEVVVEAVREQDSHMLSGLVSANCLILFPKDLKHLPADTTVEILELNWSY